MDKEVCLNCIFWKEKTTGSFYGNCRRFPPKIVFAGQPSYENNYTGTPVAFFETQFPETSKTDWCGEFSTPRIEEV